MLDAATCGSNGSGFAGYVQNASAGNYAFMLGEKGLGSAGESQTVEGVEHPQRNSRFVDREILFFETGGQGTPV